MIFLRSLRCRPERGSPEPLSGFLERERRRQIAEDNARREARSATDLVDSSATALGWLLSFFS